MTTPAFPQLPDIKALLTGPAQALANIERGFPIGPPPISIGQTLNQIASTLPVPGVPGATGIPGFPQFPPAGIQAAMSPLAPRPLAPRNGSSPQVFARTGLG